MKRLSFQKGGQNGEAYTASEFLRHGIPQDIVRSSLDTRKRHKIRHHSSSVLPSQPGGKPSVYARRVIHFPLSIQSNTLPSQLRTNLTTCSALPQPSTTETLIIGRLEVVYRLLNRDPRDASKDVLRHKWRRKLVRMVKERQP